MDADALPAGWQVWNEEPTKLILAYRPDVFDGDEFPAECLPTIYLTRGKRSRRPGAQRVGDAWHVTLYLEPDVDDGGTAFDGRDAAIDAATERAAAFAAGEIDYRGLYQVPRETYFAKLDELTGADA